MVSQSTLSLKGSTTMAIQSTAHTCYDVIEASDVLSSQGRHLQKEPF